MGRLSAMLRLHRVRMLDKRGGGGRKQPAPGLCLCRNPMPLTYSEKKLLVSFSPGRAKKAYVRQLKEKYGRL